MDETKEILTEEVVHKDEPKTKSKSARSAAKPKTATKTKTTVEKPKKKEFKPTDLIPCKSVTYGELFLKGKKTGYMYSWSNSGDIREVEYQDLLSWKVLRSTPLFDPLIIILDEDLCELWDRELGDMYRKIDNVDIEGIFDLDYTTFKNKLKTLPERVKETVKNMANSMIKDDRLYDLRKIKALDEILGTELLMMIE